VYSKAKRLVTANNSSMLDSRADLKKRVSLGCWSPQTSSRSNKQTLAMVFRNCIYLYHNNTSSQQPKAKVLKRKF
jgi:hypothetical protein